MTVGWPSSLQRRWLPSNKWPWSNANGFRIDAKSSQQNICTWQRGQSLKRSKMSKGQHENGSSLRTRDEHSSVRAYVCARAACVLLCVKCLEERGESVVVLGMWAASVDTWCKKFRAANESVFWSIKTRLFKRDRQTEEKLCNWVMEREENDFYKGNWGGRQCICALTFTCLCMWVGGWLAVWTGQDKKEHKMLQKFGAMKNYLWGAKNGNRSEANV